MHNKQYDFVVFIGKFQPFHIGHQEVLDYASKISHNVIVIIGSDLQPRTIKNPFTGNERSLMISELNYSNVMTATLRDQSYSDERWIESVQEKVQECMINYSEDRPPRIGIIGHSKDETSFYLKMFPQWKQIERPLNERVNATDIRRLLFEKNSIQFVKSVVPESVFKRIEEFVKTETYDQLVKEYEFIQGYKESWAGSPYPPMFVCTDAVVFQSGHVLMVKRKAEPGKGLWALPGGFLGQHERLVDSMIRELREETKLKVPDPVLRGSIKDSHVFDSPTRSLRGRTITHAYKIVLSPGELPKVKGSDDAEKAKWIPLNDLNSEMIYEDHFSIINYFLN